MNDIEATIEHQAMKFHKNIHIDFEETMDKLGIELVEGGFIGGTKAQMAALAHVLLLWASSLGVLCATMDTVLVQCGIDRDFFTPSLALEEGQAEAVHSIAAKVASTLNSIRSRSN